MQFYIISRLKLQSIALVGVASMLALNPHSVLAQNKPAKHSDAASIDCTDVGTSRTLHAQAQGRDAQAVWLDATRVWTPKRAGVARSALVGSATASLRVDETGALSGAGQTHELHSTENPVIPASHRWLGEGAVWSLPTFERQAIAETLKGQAWLVQFDATNRVIFSTRVQHAAALDSLYPAAELADDLGVRTNPKASTWRVWVPTAQRAFLCIDTRAVAMPIRAETGIAEITLDGNHLGKKYRYLVDVYAPEIGIVRNAVTDPYSVGLVANSTHSVVLDLDAAALKPEGWEAALRARAKASSTLTNVDLSIYELHVRDFSVADETVRSSWRGKYKAFTESGSDGMRHLARLAKAGLTDVHFLPIFDLATIPEKNCVSTLKIPTTRLDAQGGSPDERMQAAISKIAGDDCYNWGYDPLHFNVPEGSYALDADNPVGRIFELREMVLVLKKLGLRVGMDVVYNHMSAAGQHPKSVLDRLVPGYYHRLNAKGEIERSTCCDNTATEHRMMAKLMIDSAVLWVRHYGIDSYRFDLMGHQPREAMERLQREVNRVAGREIHLIGEGWNFGEVENGRRFAQAAQGVLNGTGIATFNDRMRDGVRGGVFNDSGDRLISQKGFINGGADDARVPQSTRAAQTDLVRAGLAGSVGGYVLHGKPLTNVDYRGASAGYVSSPQEVVNYVENHDNQTLYDMNVFRLPLPTSPMERARAQVLGIALTALAQGVPYFHGGIDILRSKTLDGNSYDAGDFFNANDWSQRQNGWSPHLPRKADNAHNWDVMRPFVANPSFAATPEAIAFTHAAFQDWLALRASSAMFRLRDAAAVQSRLRFFDRDAGFADSIIAYHIDGEGLAHAKHRASLVAINPTTSAKTIKLPEFVPTAQLSQFRVHPALRDARTRSDAAIDTVSRTVVIPARTAVVWVR